MVTTLQKKSKITGTDLSGTDGQTDRTYTIPVSNIESDSLQIFVNGLFKHETSEYTFTGSTVTFVIEMYDVSEITFYYIVDVSASQDVSLSFSSVLGLCTYLHIVNYITQTNTETLETIGTGDSSATLFYFGNLGVIEDTYTISYGTVATSVTDLTETTHYTVDLTTGKITLTTAGVTAVGTKTIYGAYAYNTIGLTNQELTRILGFGEREIERKTEQTFTTYTDENPVYRQMDNETFEGQEDARFKTFDAYWNPIINFSTTVNGAYTTGATSITIVTTEGLPVSGTVNIGGNKVEYSSKTATVLTIPATTPSVADGANVYGEVVEISKESEGTAPSYTVLTRDTDYKIDWLQGRIELLLASYYGETTTGRYYPANYIIRASYLSAWFEKGGTPEIPADIEQCVYMVATNRLMKSTVGKAHIEGLNSFNPSLIAVDRTDIDSIIDYYKPLHVGTSSFNKSHIS